MTDHLDNIDHVHISQDLVRCFFAEKRRMDHVRTGTLSRMTCIAILLLYVINSSHGLPIMEPCRGTLTLYLCKGSFVSPSNEEKSQFRKIVIWNADLSFVEERDFSGFTNIEKLLLANSSLPNLSIFNGLSNLKSLTVENCQIKTLGNFSSHYLQVFRITGSDIPNNEVIESIFRKTPNVDAIGLRGNKLTKINLGTFKSLAKLKSLDLCENYFQCLNASNYDWLRDLRDNSNLELNLRGNPVCLCRTECTVCRKVHEAVKNSQFNDIIASACGHVDLNTSDAVTRQSASGSIHPGPQSTISVLSTEEEYEVRAPAIFIIAAVIFIIAAAIFIIGTTVCIVYWRRRPKQMNGVSNESLLQNATNVLITTSIPPGTSLISEESSPEQ